MTTPTRPREYPAMHPERRSRALLFILVMLAVAGFVLLVYTWTGDVTNGLDLPQNSPDIMAPEDG